MSNGKSKSPPATETAPALPPDADLASIRAEAKDVRAVMLKADEALLAGQLTVELYDKITASKLELLHHLIERENSFAAVMRAESLQAQLDQRMKQAEGLAFFNDRYGQCPVCGLGGNVSLGCAKMSKVDGKEILFGVFCNKDHQFHAQGSRPLPADLVEFIHGVKTPKPSDKS